MTRRHTTEELQEFLRIAKTRYDVSVERLAASRSSDPRSVDSRATYAHQAWCALVAAKESLTARQLIESGDFCS